MSRPRLPIELGATIRPIDDLPPHLFDRAFRTACVEFDRYLGALILELAAELGLVAGDLPDAGALCRQRGWSPEGAEAVTWLLETLALYGRADPAAGGWRFHGGAPEAPSAAAEYYYLARELDTKHGLKQESIRIWAAGLADFPDDFRLNFYCAETLRGGNDEKALALYKECIRLYNSDEKNKRYGEDYQKAVNATRLNPNLG